MPDMAVSVDSPPPALVKERASLMGSISCSSTSPLFSPSSDKRFWSTLRGRIDGLLENQRSGVPDEASGRSNGVPERTKRLKEDSMLLMRGFDSIAHSLSLLSENIDNALQGARDLAQPPTLTDILHSSLRNTEESKDNLVKRKCEEEETKCLKRKFDSSNSSDDRVDESTKTKSPKNAKLTKAKNIAISMAAKAASLARELKSLKSDMSFLQERCGLLEEENRRLRDGFSKGIRPEEDDLVRLQMETLLAEKSRLANENANLIRENQCLSQLVAYHQMTSQNLSESYEEVLKGICLDFSSPIAEDEENEDPETPRMDVVGISTSLDECFQQQQ